MKNPDFVKQIVKRHNYMNALHMLCIKMGWDKEYSWYILRTNPDKCANGEREAFIKKATRLLALNYNGIHTGEEPALSPRLLPEYSPNAQPIRFPSEWRENEIASGNNQESAMDYSFAISDNIERNRTL